MCMFGLLTGSFDDNAFTARLNLGRTPSFNVFFVSSQRENLFYIYIYKHIPDYVCAKAQSNRYNK